MNPAEKDRPIDRSYLRPGKTMRAALTLSIIAHLGLLSGCSAHRRAAISAPSQPPATIQNADEVADLLRRITAALPSYQEDALARFEIPEIAAVEADLKKFGSEGGEAVFPEDYAQIEADWERLVGLDEILQKEHAI